MTHNDSQTIEKIIKIAEVHFAQQGFFASSLRQITKEADVNVASIHYHFGSKEALFLEVLNRRIVPFVNAFLCQLDKITSTKDLQAEDLVNAYATVIFNMINTDEHGAYIVARLVSRLMIDEYRVFREDLSKQYADIAMKLQDLLKRVLQGQDNDTVKWRMHMTINTLFNSFAGNNVLNALMPQENISAKDPRLVAKYVIPFVVAGLKA